MRLLGQFILFYDKHKQAQISIKNSIRHSQFIKFFSRIGFIGFSFKIRFYIKCRLKVNLALFIYTYFYVKTTVKKFYHDGFNN